MFLLDAQSVISATDLGASATCEFAVLRRADALRGRAPAVEEPVDALAQRAGVLGTKHEQRLLADYRQRFPGRVAIADRPTDITAAALTVAAQSTLAALRSDDFDVIYQATVFDGSFVGYVDFLVRTPEGWEVQDTKIARSAKVTALLQVGAYAELLTEAGVGLGRSVRLVLGDRSESVHAVRDLVPTFRRRRAHLESLLAAHEATGAAVVWGADGVRACGRCAICEAEVVEHRDLFLVASMNPAHCTALRAAGITTIDALATTSLAAVHGIGGRPFASYRVQAQQQRRSGDAAPAFAVQHPEQLGVIPAPSPGDLFFDFEGDPLYAEDEGREWNLDYLFGVTDVHDAFTPFWAHDFAQEAVALRRFLDHVAERRRLHPDLHIYHYAPYEKAHLVALAQRHGIGEDEVNELLRKHVLVDLYPVVRHSLSVGSRSYSIKKLEPLYRRETRQGVMNATDSVEEYARSCVLMAEGEVEEAQRIRDAIADYNLDDCVSTRQLRDWLLGLAKEADVAPGSIAPAVERPPVPPASALIGPLLERAAAIEDERLAQGHRMVAAALDYYRREDAAYWRGHYERLLQPITDWVSSARGSFEVQSAKVEQPWSTGPRGGRSRVVRVRGAVAPGTAFEVGDKLFAVYDGPALFERAGADAGARSFTDAIVMAVEGEAELLLRESMPVDAEYWPDLPRALAPGSPPGTSGQVAAIEEFAAILLERRVWPEDAGADLLLRLPPRSAIGRLSAVFTDDDEPDHVGAITRSLLALNDSYLAVQGPPGSGKTYVGSRVIAKLVDNGWKVGVVAQSHAVVEHLLEKVVEAGVPKHRVGKALKRERPVPFTVIKKDKQADFIRQQPGGYVVGGTAWDMANPNRIGRASLDLLVIDEAGQFSLANTTAVARSARRVLLLGDPQQLPQVSQGTHPEPVDSSALGWIIGEHTVLPKEHGYFLEQTRRMHPALTRLVSDLSYEGALGSHPSTASRGLQGVEPGLHPRPIVHAGNRTASTQEAAEVVRIVQSLSGKAWTDPMRSRDSPLTDADFVVVTPYNAQVGCIQQALRAAGHGGVEVGTVDRFQGREAPIAIVSMAASTPAYAPRGMGFLLNRNRLNVAISRAMWAAYLVHSPALMDHLPRTSEGMADLSGFLALVEDMSAGVDFR